MKDQPRVVLGLSAYYHDSAAALVRDGEIIAAAQEERFSRVKNDARFPAQSVRTCLEIAGLTLDQVDAVAFYDKPLLKFDRLIETFFQTAPRGWPLFATSMPAWLKEKLYLKSVLKREFSDLSGLKKRELPPLLFGEHHRSHAASAFFPSPFPRAAVLCLDGVGEWATTSAWIGEGSSLRPLWEIRFPHSIGLLYSAFTAYCGFKVNSGEYKLMGLAAYGEPKYASLILERLIDLKEDGSFRLNPDFFSYATGKTMFSRAFERLFGGPPRKADGPLTQREMDLARSVQVVTEEVLLRLARTIARETGEKHLCLAGGVALNCVANGRLLREGIFEDLWIQPAAGDAGGALGAALSAWHEHFLKSRTPRSPDAMKGSLLGRAWLDDEIEKVLVAKGAVSHRMTTEGLDRAVSELLADGKVVGWFQGRAEFGPRALGSRSILADPRRPDMQSVLNLKIKFRESFRPFAPAVLLESVSEAFVLDRASPYMLLAANVSPRMRVDVTTVGNVTGLDRLKIQRTSIPAVTHVDLSARVQTVDGQHHPRFSHLLRAFENRTSCPLLVNTSFNVRGEPIVESPAEAYRCFMKTGMDALAIGEFLLLKEEQPKNLIPDPKPPVTWASIKAQWLKLTSPLERTMNAILLSLVYFVLILPISIVRRRVSGSDWRPDGRLESYRSFVADRPYRMERPF